MHTHNDTIMLRIIGNIKELVLLNVFMCNQLSDVAITTTANFQCSRGLKNLTIAFCTGLTDESLKAVGENCQELEKLDMQGCEQHCPDMEELDMENCKAVTDVGIMAIAEGCMNVKNLKMNRCKKVTNKGMIALSDNCRKLEELDVWHCPKLTDIRMYPCFLENMTS